MTTAIASKFTWSASQDCFTGLGIGEECGHQLVACTLPRAVRLSSCRPAAG